MLFEPLQPLYLIIGKKSSGLFLKKFKKTVDINGKQRYYTFIGSHNREQKK